MKLVPRLLKECHSVKTVGSCLLWVMSTEISVDIAVDIAVDTRSIVGRQSVDSEIDYRPRHIWNDYRPCLDRVSTHYRPLYRPAVDRVSTEYRPTVDRLSTECRRSIDRVSTAISTAISTDISVDITQALITHSKQDPAPQARVACSQTRKPCRKIWLNPG